MDWHLSLRIHDTLVPKMTANVTFMPFLCFNLITSVDGSYKVYISLKLRAFCIHFKKENHKNGTGTKLQGMGSILFR